MSRLTEDSLVQQTSAEYLHDVLGWESVYAFEETFGPESMLGRASDREVVLTRYLRAALERLNPGFPDAAYADAVRQITEYGVSQSGLATNREKDALLRDGVLVSFRADDGRLKKERMRVFDFSADAATQNHFLCVREFWVRGDLYRRRADLVGFVNGVPLLFCEFKNVSKNLRDAYDGNLKDYRDTVPHLFHHNAIVVLSNGLDAKIGAVFSPFEHFHEWKRLDEEEAGAVDLETLLKGVCAKSALMDIFENFVVFDDSSGKTAKIVAKNHQYLGVNRAVEAVRQREQRAGKLGVFWHTQGSGKSYSMVFFTRKVHRRLGGNFTFLICTDRDDLDTQIYKTFAGCGLVDHDRDPCRPSSGQALKRMLAEQKTHVFTLIQKFNKDVDPTQPWNPRGDLIVISDEAHRTQYGRLALNLRNALPNASYIGFTGTPLMKDDEITQKVFGGYLSTYDFQRAVDDNATVPLFYAARGERLGIATTELNERVAEKLEELETDDIDVTLRLERELKRDYHVITAEKRLQQIADDFVRHYSTGWETGKAMLVCVDKVTCGRLHAMITPRWLARIAQLEKELSKVTDEQEAIFRERQIAWMQETKIAVIISEEQGEVEKFRKWNLDVTGHRKLIKDGFALPDGRRVDVESAFKDTNHPFRVAIVCAMWLTGFDVPSLSTLYLDKPLKAHTLMQAIARANRVHEGKANGLIVDYCGIFKNLRKALATFAGHADSGRSQAEMALEEGLDPAKPEQELLDDLAEAIVLARDFLAERGASLEAVHGSRGFTRNAAVAKAKEAANQNDESRRRFEVMCREVFRRFKSCLTIRGINAHRHDYDALNLIYGSLQSDRNRTDITDIILQLHQIVDQAIETRGEAAADVAQTTFDISRIDFEKLRREFARSKAQNTTVQNLRAAIEKKVQRLMAQNPFRTDLQRHYEMIVADYNREKDRATLERTFEDLVRLVQELNEEEARAMREELDEESLAIFDLLRKPELTPTQIRRIKEVSAALLATLKQEKLRVDRWPEKETTRDAVQIAIHNFLFSDGTGLPIEAYSEEEVNARTRDVFRHVLRVYPTLPSPVYDSAA
jgi:type I restriction enzyme R subunit